jgi:hypothetical protein
VHARHRIVEAHPEAVDLDNPGVLTKRFIAVSRNIKTSETSGFFVKFYTRFASVLRSFREMFHETFRETVKNGTF